MFWLGLGLGFLCGGIAGALIIAIFAGGTRSDK